MHTTRLRALILALCGLAFAAPASAQDAATAEVQSAAALLSRFHDGDVPVESSVVSAIHTLGARGGPADVALLASLAARERTEIHDAAVRAIAAIRERQRSRQREVFASSLPDPPDLRAATRRLVDAGLGDEEAGCVAYAGWILGDADAAAVPLPADVSGDGATLLAEGRPAAALAVAAAERDEHTAALAAADLGDPTGAIVRLTRLAAEGDGHAHESLAAWGIDAERLLLGWMSGRAGSSPNEARVLDVLVRRGGRLTVEVLVERTRGPVASERAMALDALARMVDGAGRSRPLSVTLRDEAVGALRRVSLDTPDPVRGVALAAMEQLEP